MKFEIKKIDRNTEMAEKLLRYIENFSWEEVKEHAIRLIRNWEFSEWETMFAAIDDDKIIGIASIMKSDYYPLPDIYPWVSSIFVSEEYRGQR